MLRITGKPAPDDLMKALEGTFVSFGPVRPPSGEKLPEDKEPQCPRTLMPASEDEEQESQPDSDEEEETPAG